MFQILNRYPINLILNIDDWLLFLELSRDVLKEYLLRT